MSEFHRDDERCDFQVGGYFGGGGGEANPTSSVQYLFVSTRLRNGSSLKRFEVGC